MSAGVSCWLVNQNINAPSEAIKSADAQSFYDSPLYTEGEKAGKNLCNNFRICDYIFKKEKTKEDVSLTNSQSQFVLGRLLSEFNIFSPSTPQAEVLSCNQRYL